MKLIARVAALVLVWLSYSTNALSAQSCPVGMPVSTPNSDFVDVGSGTVRHVPTGLIWKRCSEGQSWDGTTCTGNVIVFDWHQALQRVDDVNLGTVGHNAGLTDWRLPNQKEIRSLVETGCVDPSINAAQFPATPSFTFWSSTPLSAIPGSVWSVDFYQGRTFWEDRNSAAGHVRLVRGGANYSNFDAAHPTGPVTTTPIPTLSEWSLVILMVLIAALTGNSGKLRKDPLRETASVCPGQNEMYA
jgi:hypothetical protein